MELCGVCGMPGKTDSLANEAKRFPLCSLNPNLSSKSSSPAYTLSVCPDCCANFYTTILPWLKGDQADLMFIRLALNNQKPLTESKADWIMRFNPNSLQGSPQLIAQLTEMKKPELHIRNFPSTHSPTYQQLIIVESLKVGVCFEWSFYDYG